MAAPFFILFSLMLIGYFSGRHGWITPVMNEGISNILVYIAMPALLISSITELGIKGGTLAEFALMTGLSVGLFFVYALLSVPYARLAHIPPAHRAMVRLSMLSSNNGFMGFPITLAFFGQKGLLLMVANNLAMCIVLWTYGVHVLKKGKRKALGETGDKGNAVRDFFHQIMNPNVISIFIGLGLGLTGIDGYLPEALKDLLAMLGSLATPLSMIFIGVTLSESKITSLFHDRLALSATITRAVAYFAVTLGVVFFLPVPALMKQICLLVIALPSAAVIPVMTAMYGKGKKEATKIVVLSTLLSILTAPVGVWIAYRLF